MSYIDEIQAAFAAHPEIAEYRINLAERTSVGIGIRDNDVGSVYSPFSFGQSTGGGFLVQWQDGRLSRGNLDGNSLAILDQVLRNARQAAYDDPDVAQFLPQQQIHDVPLFADDVPPLFGERSGYLIEVVTALQALAARYDAKTLNGGVGAGSGTSWLRTSQGLDLSTRSSSFSYSASFDGMIGEGRSQRMVAGLDEIAAQIDLAGSYLGHLRTPVDGGASGERLVILHPDVAYSLLGYYLWGNLGGGAVFHGQSPFRAEDFRSGKQVLREDMTIRVDPWEPLGSASFMYTGEGLPSQPTTYIDCGRLTQPIVDLKYSRRLGMPPTTPPGGERSVHLTGPAETSWEELLPQVDDAILVLSVLGLHTQDRSSGSYSLSTSQALLVEGGALRGRVKATIAGNFLEQLRDPRLRLVRFAGQHSPGFVLPIGVAVERAAE